MSDHLQREGASMGRPRYPGIYCALGEGENIFAIVGRIRGEMRRGRISNEEIERFTAEVQATRSYSDALAVCSRWVLMP
jgi:hypothetical protein